MKLQLLHIFDDGREAFIANHCGEEWGVIVRSFDGSWPAFAVDRFSRTALEAARDEALEVDHKITTPSAIYLKKGRRSVALYGSVAYLKWRDAVIDEVQEVQAAFRWLFLGRLD